MQYSKEILMKYMDDVAIQHRELLPRIITEILNEKEQISIDFSSALSNDNILQADIVGVYIDEPEVLFVNNPNYVKDYYDFSLFYYEDNQPLQYRLKSDNGDITGYGENSFRLNINDDFKDIRVKEDVDNFIDFCYKLSMYDGIVACPYGAVTVNNR